MAKDAENVEQNQREVVAGSFTLCKQCLDHLQEFIYLPWGESRSTGTVISIESDRSCHRSLFLSVNCRGKQFVFNLEWFFLESFFFSPI